MGVHLPKVRLRRTEVWDILNFPSPLLPKDKGESPERAHPLWQGHWGCPPGSLYPPFSQRAKGAGG